MTAITHLPGTPQIARRASPALFVRETGQGAPMLLLHGLASSSRYWEPHFATLGRSYRVIAPDLLGFGRSPKPFGAAYTTEEHLEALMAAVERRVDGPLTLVGHSMGSVLALRLAVSRPQLVERLILVALPAVGDCAWGHHPDGGRRRFHHFAVHTTPGRLLFSAGQHGFRPLGTFVYPPLRRDIPRGAAEDSLRSSWTAYWRSLEEVVYGTRVEDLFAAVRGPFTVIHGERDVVAPVAPVRALAGTRPDVSYIELPNAGHNPCYTHERAFYAALDGRLEPQSQARPLRPQSPLMNTLRCGYAAVVRRSVQSRR